MSASAPSISTVAFPPRGTVLERLAAADLVATLQVWLAASTDRILALDAQWQTIGPDASPGDQADVAASFLAHKAISTRIAEMGTPDGQKIVGELCERPVFAEDGSAVAANLSDACVILEAIVDRTESSLHRTATTVHETARLRSAINSDLVVAENLAQRLGDQIRHINELSVRATAAMARLADPGGPNDDSNPAELVRLAADIAKVRATLERAEAERQQLIGSWSALPARIEQMKAQESAARELRERCEVKIRPLPKLAVPSVAAIEAPMPVEQFETQPWPAIQPQCRTYLGKLDRLQAALDEVQRRYSAPLRERDELRGLVQAFHDKAGESGLGEHPDLEPAYRAAVDELWTAPCNLDNARGLVQRYLAAVNRITDGESARSANDPIGSTGDATP